MKAMVAFPLARCRDSFPGLKLLSPPPQSSYSMAEAESFVVTLRKMPRCRWETSLPAWPPCQLSCRHTQSLLATEELRSVMCSICRGKRLPSVCEHNRF